MDTCVLPLSCCWPTRIALRVSSPPPPFPMRMPCACRFTRRPSKAEGLWMDGWICSDYNVQKYSKSSGLCVASQVHRTNSPRSITTPYVNHCRCRSPIWSIFTQRPVLNSTVITGQSQQRHLPESKCVHKKGITPGRVKFSTSDPNIPNLKAPK
jgi:hypothetical protein